jgi:hypothetical protein
MNRSTLLWILAVGAVAFGYGWIIAKTLAILPGGQ